MHGNKSAKIRSIHIIFIPPKLPEPAILAGTLIHKFSTIFHKILINFGSEFFSPSAIYHSSQIWGWIYSFRPISNTFPMKPVFFFLLSIIKQKKIAFQNCNKLYRKIVPGYCFSKLIQEVLSANCIKHFTAIEV